VGWHAVRLSSVEIALCSALVLGAGPIGLAVIQALVLRGARHIIVSEPSAAKRKLATKFGATHVFDPRNHDIAAECCIVGEGEGVHVAFDCVGKQMTLDQAVSATGSGATVVNIAIWGGMANISPNVFALTEKRFVGSSVYTEEDFREVVKAITSGEFPDDEIGTLPKRCMRANSRELTFACAGSLRPADMITSRVSLDSVVEEGIQGCLIDGCEDHVKVLVDLSL
jgi:threonine dehydrogenase-like Zn-dependent dehydrogenase